MKIDLHPESLHVLRDAWRRGTPDADVIAAVRDLFDARDGELPVINKALDDLDRCGACGKYLDRGDDYPADVQHRSHGMTYQAHGECADGLLDERKTWCGSGEHEWPAELDGDAECERGCGLRYDEWSE